MSRLASIPATSLHSLSSRPSGSKYVISIALPDSYAHSRTKYPCVYVLDGNTLFGLATDLSRNMHIAGDIPETIVVGVAYPSSTNPQNRFRTWFRRRAFDFTPVVDREIESELARVMNARTIHTGGAERFLQFLATQVIPFVDSRFRTNRSRRVLCGHSLGGLFVLYALFARPQAFSGYIAASPSLFYANRILLRAEGQYSKKYRSLAASLFICVGDKEEGLKETMTSDAIRFAGLVRARSYKGLAVSSLVVQGCGHGGSVAPAFQAGFQKILAARPS